MSDRMDEERILREMAEEDAAAGRSRKSARARSEQRSARRRRELPPEDPELATRAFDPAALAAASLGERAEASPPPDGELATRTFDPAALAAASMAPEATSHWRRWIPGVLGGVLVLSWGVMWAIWPKETVEPPPPISLDGLEDEGAPEEAWWEEDGPEADAPDRAAEVAARLAEAGAEAQQHEDEGRYEQALAVYTALSPEVRADHMGAVESAETRLRAKLAFAGEARELLGRARAAWDAGVLGGMEVVAEQAEALLNERAIASETPEGQRLMQFLVAVAEAQATAAQAEREAAEREGAGSSGDPDLEDLVVEEPPERAQAFAAQASRGRQVVEAVRRRIEQDKTAASERYREEVERARRASAADPQDVELFGVLWTNATLRDFDDVGVRLSSGRNETYARWEALPAELALEFRRLGVRDDDADDLERFARWCVRFGCFEEAREAFTEVVRLDPRRIEQVPDVTALARASRQFGGQVEARGTSWEVSYAFDRAPEAQDWQDQGRARGVVRESRLEVHGSGVFLTASPEIGFEERVSLVATLGPTNNSATCCLGFAFQAGTSQEQQILAAVNRRNGVLAVVRRFANGRSEILESVEGSLRSQRITVEFRDGRFRVRLRGFDHVSVPLDPTWQGVRVLVGGALDRGSGGASVEDLVVSGRVRYEWLRKSDREVQALLAGVLDGDDELPVFQAPPGRPPTRELSAEDGFGVRGLSDGIREAYQRAVAAAASGDPLRRLEAASTLQDVLEQAPQFAAARFRLAQVLDAMGRPHVALGELDRAIASIPHFYEAMALRAQILAQLRRFEDAKAQADQAIEERPDAPEGWAARGQVAFLEGALQAAQSDLEIALALNPWDDAARSALKNVRHVLDGPPWEHVFERETQHYLVQTNISQRRCDEFADELEAIRRFFARFFDPSADDERHAKVLIFDTREGFHSYAALTTSDRVENLLGVYLPRYGQLLLYEDKDDAEGEETRRVLYHEAFHQFIAGIVPEMPFWLNEGLAEYFSGSRIEGGEVTRRGLRLDGRLRDLRAYVQRRGAALPMAELMQETPAEFYSGAVAVKYAQAWAMVYFFEHGSDPEIQARFHRYMDLLVQGRSASQAFHMAWGGTPWPEVERAWWAWLETR